MFILFFVTIPIFFRITNKQKNMKTIDERSDELLKPLNTNKMFLVVMLVVTAMTIIYFNYYYIEDGHVVIDGVEYVENIISTKTPVIFKDAGRAEIEWTAMYYTKPVSGWDKVFGKHIDSRKFKYTSIQLTGNKDIDNTIGLIIENKINIEIRKMGMKHSSTYAFFTRPNVDEIINEILEFDNVVEFKMDDIVFNKQFLAMIKNKQEMIRREDLIRVNIIEDSIKQVVENLRNKKLALDIIRHDSIEIIKQKNKAKKDLDDALMIAKKRIEEAEADREKYYSEMKKKIRLEIIAENDSLNKFK